MISSVIRGTVLVSILIGTALYIISRYSKNEPNSLVKLFNAVDASSVHTLQSFVDSTGVTWTLGADDSGRFYYSYTPVSSQPILLWDSINNRHCANWLAMRATNPPNEFTVLAVTPNYITENGTLVVFSFILAAGDVRITSAVDTRFWSIANTASLPLQWPSTIAANTVLWQTSSPSDNTIVTFTSSGEISVISVNSSNAIRWNASTFNVQACV